MKNILFLILIMIGCGVSQAQMSARDSISGGSYIIQGNAVIDSLVQKTVKAKCARPVDANGSNGGEPVTIDPCSQNPKVMGYKIQIMYTKDRNAANRAKSNFSNQFPSLVPEMVYTQPDYRVLAGDYFTKRSAAMDLSAVKKKYPGAFLVQWRVWCRKAK